MKFINVIVAGATGYIGLELIKLLVKHPNVKIKYLCGNKTAGSKIYKFDKSLKKYKDLPTISKINKINFTNIDVIFTALPNGEAQLIAKKIKNKSVLIDLSGDFRLDNSTVYKKWYKINHKAKELIKHSIYSIPEFAYAKIKNYKIIACPGCYPTSVQIPLIPILKNKINPENIIIDSKSGYSGAGKSLHKKFKQEKIFESISAYGVASHKHVAEINQELNKITKKNISVTFTPHLSPMFRGILSTIYLDLKKNVTANDVYQYLKKFYKNNNFININKFNKPIGTTNVINTNKCLISVCKGKNNNKIIILSAIDNLIRGGSGQAVQNMNIMYGFEDWKGFK